MGKANQEEKNQYAQPASHEAHREISACVLALEDKFESYYDVNLESGIYHLYVKNQTYFDFINDKMVDQKDFFADTLQNVDAVVYPDDREEILKLLKKENIVKVLSGKSYHDQYYRLVVDGQPVWFRMRLVYKDEKKQDIIIGVFNAEEEMKAKQRAEKSREDLINQMMGGESAYLINPILDEYRTLYRNRYLAANYIESDTYSASVSKYVENDVYEPDCELMRKETSIPVITARLKTESDYSVVFRDVSMGVPCRYKMRVVGLSPSEVLLGFSNFDKEYIEDAIHERIKDDFFALYVGDLDGGYVKVIKKSPWYSIKEEGAIAKYAKTLQAFADSNEGEARDFFTKLGDLDYLKKALKDESKISVTYKSRYVSEDKWVTATCYVLRRLEDGTPAVCCLAFSILDALGAEREELQQLREENAELDAQLARRQGIELIKSKLRADALAFVSEHEPDVDKFMDFFGNRILEISGCDQVIFRNLEGHRVVLNAPGISDVPQDICSQCPFAQFDNDTYYRDGAVLMNDCKKGTHGIMTHPDCPAKSSFMQRIYLGGKLVGLLSVHYLNDYHTFSDDGIDIMKTVASYLGILLGRIEAKRDARAKLEAESSNKAKTDFLFNMSHDIRTPMNAIIGFTNMALKHLDNPEKVKDCLEKTQQSGNLLLSLINSILDMSRIESGNAVLEQNPGDVYLCFVTFEETMRELALEKSIDLSFSFGEIRDQYVFVDFVRCTRIFVNIITNSIKYTKEGGYVKVKCEQIDSDREGYGKYRFTFEDNGIGMSDEFQEHVFDRFSREIGEENQGIQGTGLGMAVVKSFVDLMNGSITCESKKNVGTKIVVELSFKIQTGKENINPYTGELVVGGVSAEEVHDFTGKRALLAEDIDLNREIALDILEEGGFNVETARDGQEAVNLMKEKGPDYFDFILMDIQMPVLNGYEATTEIRKLYPDAKVPIIALSANAFEEDKNASQQAGMNDHVAKPINIKELYRVLARYM